MKADKAKQAKVVIEFVKEHIGLRKSDVAWTALGDTEEVRYKLAVEKGTLIQLAEVMARRLDGTRKFQRTVSLPSAVQPHEVEALATCVKDIEGHLKWIGSTIVNEHKSKAIELTTTGAVICRGKNSQVLYFHRARHFKVRVQTPSCHHLVFLVPFVSQLRTTMHFLIVFSCIPI